MIDSLSIALHAFVSQFPGSGRVFTAVWMHHLGANKTTRKEARRQLHKNVYSNIE